MAIFQGDKKVGGSVLSSIEKRIVDRYVSKIPKGLETYHLTLMTIAWSAGVLASSYLAGYNFNWLWLTSVFIALQYITDLFDGAVGRYRDTGLIKWGYYMDHFLDYIFLCSILIGYTFFLPIEYDRILFFILAILGAYLVNSFLAFAATNEFRIAYLGIGPTEIRILFIIINILFVAFGKTYIYITLPVSLGLSVFGLGVVVYRTQKYIWNLDMKHKPK